jgi:hypothetical protein
MTARINFACPNIQLVTGFVRTRDGSRQPVMKHVERRPYMTTLLGLGYHSQYHQIATATATKSAPHLSTAVDLLKVSAWCGLAAALAIWAVFAKEIYQITGLIKRPAK